MEFPGSESLKQGEHCRAKGYTAKNPTLHRQQLRLGVKPSDKYPMVLYIIFIPLTHPRYGASKLHPAGQWKLHGLDSVTRSKDNKHAISYEQGHHAYLSLTAADTYGKISALYPRLDGCYFCFDELSSFSASSHRYFGSGVG